MDAQNVHPLLTAKIVGSYLRHHTVGTNQLPDLITSVHRALSEVTQPSPPEVLPTPAVSVRQSVRHEYVTCLDCGYRGQTLRRHISSRHGLSREEYLRRWGLQAGHPLTAPAYTERRSTLAKQLGLGRKPEAEAAVTPMPPEPAIGNTGQKAGADSVGSSETSGLGSRSDVGNEAAPQPRKPRERRTRSRAAPPQSEPVPTPTADS
jgi:predicted transcriptional regulator